MIHYERGPVVFTMCSLGGDYENSQGSRGGDEGSLLWLAGIFFPPIFTSCI